MNPLSLISVIVVLAAATVWCAYRFARQFKDKRPNAEKAVFRDWTFYLVMAGLLMVFIFAAAEANKTETDAISLWSMPALLGAFVVGFVAKEHWRNARLARFWALLGSIAAVHGFMFAVVLRRSWSNDWLGVSVAVAEIIFARLAAPYVFSGVVTQETPSVHSGITTNTSAGIRNEQPPEFTAVLNFEYQISADEYVACQMLHHNQTAGQNRLANGVFWIAAGAFAIVVGCRQEVSNWATILLVGAGAWWAYSGLTGIFPAAHYRRFYTQSRLAGHTYRARIGNAGFEVIDDNIPWRILWPGVTHKAESENAFMISSANTIFIWGKRFLSAEQQNELRQLAGL